MIEARQISGNSRQCPFAIQGFNEKDEQGKIDERIYLCFEFSTTEDKLFRIYQYVCRRWGII